MVQDALAAVLPYEAVHVGVAVTDGVVTLSGRLLTQAERRAAHEATFATGVQAIADDLVISGEDDAHPTNTHIALAVRRRLHRAETLREDSALAIVDSGVVTLTGDVADEAERDAAIRVVTHVRGVHEVRDRLALRSSSHASPATTP